MSSFVQAFLPLLFLIMVSSLYLKLIKSSGVIKTPSAWFSYGITFLFLAALNFISSVFLNDYYSIMNFRYVLNILTIGVFILSINIYNRNLFIVFKYTFIMFSILNIIIILTEQILWLFDKDILKVFQEFLAPKGTYWGPVNRNSLGVGLIRPVGLFGGIHSSSLLVLLSFLAYISSGIKLSTVKINLYWFILMCFIYSLQSGQTIILATLAFSVDRLVYNNKNKIQFILVISIIITGIIFWLEATGHFDEKLYSMWYLLKNSTMFFQIFPDSSCFIFGCSLSGSEIMSVARTQANFIKYIAFTDNGYLSSFLAFGMLFYVVYILYCFSILKLNLIIVVKKALFSGSLVIGATIIHYPIGFGAGIYALFLMNFYVKYHTKSTIIYR
jgi:hypothetical protein